MFSKVVNHTNRYFLAQFTTFAVVVVVFASALFYVLFYSYAEQVNKDKRADIQFQLNNVVNRLNTMLEMVSVTGNNLLLEDTFIMFRDSVAGEAEYDPLLYKDLMMALQNEKHKNGYIRSIIVPIDDQTFLTDVGSMDMQTYFKDYYRWNDEDIATVKEMNHSKPTENTMILRSMTIQSKLLGSSTEVHVLPVVLTYNSYESSKTITVLLDIGSIVNEIDAYLSASRNYVFTIHDSDGRELFYHGNGEATDPGKENFLAENSSFGKLSVRLELRAADGFFESWKMLALLFPVILLLSILVSFFIASLLNKPVKKLFRYLSDELSGVPDRDIDFSDVRILFDELKVNKGKLEKELEVIKHAEMIRDIITGRLSAGQEDEPTSTGLRFPYDRYVLLLVKMDVFESVKSLLSSCPGVMHISFNYMDGNVLQLINYEDDRVLERFLGDSFVDPQDRNRPICVWLSDSFIHIDHAPKALEQVTGMLSYYPLEMTFPCFIRFANIAPLHKLDEKIGGEMEIKLLNNIKAGNGETARQLVKEYMDDFTRHGFIGISMVCDLIYIVQKAMEEVKNRQDELAARAKDLNESLYRYDRSAEGILVVLDEFIDWACEVVRANKESANNQLAQSIIQYIETNYNKDISMLELADKFHLSYKYLSRYFKDQTGINITDYIHIVRIRQAKTIIKENKDKRILDICKIVGYENIQTFRRNFKKFEGVTPTEVN